METSRMYFALTLGRAGRCRMDRVEVGERYLWRAGRYCPSRVNVAGCRCPSAELASQPDVVDYLSAQRGPDVSNKGP